jgi:hypothetical protein
VGLEELISRMNVSIRHGSMLDAKDSILSMIAKLAYVLAFGMITPRP